MTLQLLAKHVTRDNTRYETLSCALTARPVVGMRTQTQLPTANSAQMVGTPLPGHYCAQCAIETRLIMISIHRRPVKAVQLDMLRQLQKRPRALGALRVSSTTIRRSK